MSALHIGYIMCGFSAFVGFVVIAHNHFVAYRKITLHSLDDKRDIF